MVKTLVNILSVGGRAYFPALTNLFASLIVIKSASIELWGAYIGVVVYVNLFGQLVYWGHREPLIRKLAQNGQHNDWHAWFWTRFPLLAIPLLYFSFVSTSFDSWCLIGVAVLAQFISASITSLVDFHKRFKTGLVAELVPGLLFLAYLIWCQNELTVQNILGGYAIQQGCKMLIYAVLLRRLIFPLQFVFNGSLLLEGIPFLLILLSGFLNSRVDVLMLEAMGNESLLGSYHIMANFLIQAQAIGGILLMPISRGLYRLSRSSFTKLLVRWMLLGTLIAVLVALILPPIIDLFYGIQLSWWYSLAFFVFILPSFPNQVFIFWAYRNRQDKRVVLVNYLGVILHITFISIALYSGLDLLFILLASGVAKSCISVTYFVQFKIN